MNLREFFEVEKHQCHYLIYFSSLINNSCINSSLCLKKPLKIQIITMFSNISFFCITINAEMLLYIESIDQFWILINKN